MAKQSRITLFLISLFLLGHFFASAQVSYGYRPIDIYNDYITNPAFIEGAEAVRIDIIGSSFWIGFPGHPVEMMVNLNSSLPKTGVSIRTGYFYESIGAYESHGIISGLAYKYKLTDKLAIRAGMDFIYRKGKITGHFYDLTGSVQSGATLGKSGYSLVGGGVDFRDFTGGISANFRFIDKMEVSYADSTISYAQDPGFLSLFAFARYRYTIKEIISLSPQICYNNESGFIALVSCGLYNFLHFGMSYRIGKNYRMPSRVSLSCWITPIRNLECRLLYTPGRDGIADIQMTSISMQLGLMF